MMHPLTHCFALSKAIDEGREIIYDTKKNKWSARIQRPNRPQMTMEVAQVILDHLKKVSDELSDRELGNGYSLVAKKVSGLVKQFPKSESVEELFIGLKRQQYGLQYRFGLVRKNRNPDSTQFQNILDEWKDRPQVEFWRRSYKWREFDDRQLTKLASYGKVAKRLLNNDRFQNEVMDLVIRGKLPVEWVVEYPNLARGLEYHLSERIGRMRGAIAKIGRKEGHKVPEILVDGKWQSIFPLDRTINIRGWPKTMGEVMSIFADREERMGDYEVFPTTGITPWNDFELGWKDLSGDYTRISIPIYYSLVSEYSKEDWWRPLPPIDRIDAREVNEYFGVEMKSGQWGEVKRASRLTQNLNYLHNHSWTEMLIPVLGPDRQPVEPALWDVYPFGKYPKEYPIGLMNGVTFCLKTHDSVVGYVDENVYNLRREHEGKCDVGTQEDGLRVMNKIYEDIALGYNGELRFQIMGSNCDYWTNRIIEVFTGNNVDHESHLPLDQGTVGDGFTGLFDALKGGIGVRGPKKTRWVFTRLGAKDREDFNLSKFEPFWDRFLLSSPSKWIENMKEARRGSS